MLKPAMRSALRPALRPAMRQPTVADPPMTLIEMASDLANRAHLGQRRKISGIPYIVHPFRVAAMVDHYGGSQEQIAAAWCHDVLEDCPAAFGLELESLPLPVVSLVRQLTKDIDPATGKGVKGELFMMGLRAMSQAAALVKLCDRIDNINDGIRDMPIDWLARYTAESVGLAQALNRPGLEPAHDMLMDLIGMATQRIETGAAS